VKAQPPTEALIEKLATEHAASMAASMATSQQSGHGAYAGGMGHGAFTGGGKHRREVSTSTSSGGTTIASPDLSRHGSVSGNHKPMPTRVEAGSIEVMMTVEGASDCLAVPVTPSTSEVLLMARGGGAAEEVVIDVKEEECSYPDVTIDVKDGKKDAESRDIESRDAESRDRVNDGDDEEEQLAATFHARTTDPSLAPLARSLGNSTKLELYALYKQATVGDCGPARPSKFDVRARAKFDAWARTRGMALTEAMKEYLRLLESVVESAA